MKIFRLFDSKILSAPGRQRTSLWKRYLSMITLSPPSFQCTGMRVLSSTILQSFLRKDSPERRLFPSTLVVPWFGSCGCWLFCGLASWLPAWSLCLSKASLGPISGSQDTSYWTLIGSTIISDEASLASSTSLILWLVMELLCLLPGSYHWTPESEMPLVPAGMSNIHCPQNSIVVGQPVA